MDIDSSKLFAKLQAQALANLHPFFPELAELYSRKLWFELTNTLEALLKSPAATGLVLPIYLELVVPLAKKISPEAYVRFTVAAAAQLGNAQEAIKMLLEVAEQFKGKAEQSHLFVFARMTAAFYQLGLGAVDEAKSAIEECLPLVEAFAGVDPSIKAVFYKVRSEFDKFKALFSAYYRDALLYLACVKVGDLSVEDQIAQCHDLCVAALLGETVYNFGELLMHPILQSIRGDGNLAYLEVALHAFNSGDHAKFESVLPKLAKNQVLAGRIDFLRQKMCLMALVECIFAHLKESRQLAFAVIAEASRVPVEEVEFLLMKALSLGIIKGSIDEVGQSVTIDWVQPRVLDRSQLMDLRASIHSWKERIRGIGANIDVLSSALPDVMAE